MNPFNERDTPKLSSERCKQFRCCVAGCPTRSSNGFHNFPRNKTVCLKWMEATNKQNLDVNGISQSFHKVCKRHFADNDFEINLSGKKKLKKGSIPTKFLPVEITVSQEPKITHSNDPKPTENQMHEVETVKETSNNASISNLSEKLYDQTKRIEDLEKLVKQLKGENRIANTKLRRSEKKVKLLRQKMKTGNLNQDNVLKFLAKTFNNKQLDFLKMQIKNTGKKNRGQRYSMEQKSLSLSLYKQGPKCYRFMQKIFALPNKRTLQRHNAYMHFEAGVDKRLLEFIKKKVDELPEIEKYCFISWDEQSLKGHLEYNHANDLLNGFVDFGYLRRPTFATHSLAFMVRGINSGYKQSVSFFYTDDLKAYELAEIIRQMIDAVLDTGLKIIGSTCDQVNINVSAINRLRDPTYDCKMPKKQDGEIYKYVIRGIEIIHCFDLPHLIKVIRNNLLTKDLIHSISKRWNIFDSAGCIDKNKSYTASWDYVAAAYKFNTGLSQNQLKKIDDEHITPNKLKMKVSVATQVFSQTYGNFLLYLHDNKHFTEDCLGTAQILLFFNDLFDSLNGSGDPQTDTLFGSVNERAIHFVFWEYALSALSNMSFIDKSTKKRNNRSSVILKFMSTIRGYVELSRICLNLNMKNISWRNGNQDGLENLFGGINSCNHVTIKPTPTQFKTGYATMLVNNLNSGTSLSSNCEQDFSKPLVDNVHELLLMYNEIPKQERTIRENSEEMSIFNPDDLIIFDPQDLTDSDRDELVFFNPQELEMFDAHEMFVFEPEVPQMDLSLTDNEAISRLCCTVSRMLVERTECSQCIDVLETSSTLTTNDMINTLADSDYVPYKNPSPAFIKSFKALYYYSSQIIPDLCSEKSLKRKMINQLLKESIDEMGCVEHKSEVERKMREFAVDFAIKDFVKNINSLLSGKNTVILPESNNIQKLAFDFKKKGKNNKKYKGTDKTKFTENFTF